MPKQAVFYNMSTAFIPRLTLATVQDVVVALDNPAIGAPRSRLQESIAYSAAFQINPTV